MTDRRAAASVPDALSFSRSAMRELLRGRWRIEKVRIDLDAEGRGEVLYRLAGHGWTFHFFLVSIKLREEEKLDRNFAQSWDAMGVLCQGEWTPEREAYLRREVPLQRSGRADYDTLMYARGNRSGRLFEQVVDCLAAGRQPDVRDIAQVGYILRTTAFIGNGQLGTRPLAGYEPGHPMRRPYHAQMWSGFLLREYVFDLVDHMARARDPGAARLDPALRRFLGLGNSAATGLVPFITNHPHLIGRWIGIHEAAVARARARPCDPGQPPAHAFRELLERAIRYYAEGRQEPCPAFTGGAGIVAGLRRVAAAHEDYLRTGAFLGRPTRQPWDALYRWVDAQGQDDTREVVASLLLELYPDIVDDYRDAFEADETVAIDPSMRADELAGILREDYGWALGDPDDRDDAYYFWYRSAQAPRDLRRGIRDLAPHLESETTMDVVHAARRLYRAAAEAGRAPLAELLPRHPELRHIAGRVQAGRRARYGELRVNFLERRFSPFAAIRLVLVLYGMEKFEAALPKSVRGALLQGAPIAEDVENGYDGVWPFPLIPAPGSTQRGAQVAAEDVPPPATEVHTPSCARVWVDRDAVVAAPIDLLRPVQAAMQAAGASLGIAEDLAPWIVARQAMDGSGIDAMLGWRAPHDGPLLPRRCGEHAYLLDTGETCCAWLLPAMVDLALHGASGGRAWGLALAREARDPALAAQAVSSCADRGMLAVAAWAGEAPGYAIAGPGDPAPWFAMAPLERPSDFYRRAWSDALPGPAPGDLADALREAMPGTQRDAPAPPAGLALACMRADAATAAVVMRALEPAGKPARPGSRHDGPADTARRRWEAQRYGIELPRALFDRLAAAAHALLVPTDEEGRLRPDEGTDPLKVF